MLQETHSASQVDLPQSHSHVRHQECFDTQTWASEDEWTDTRYWAMTDQLQSLAAPIQVCRALALRGRSRVDQDHLLRLGLFHVHDLDLLLGGLRLVLEEVRAVAAVLLPSRVSTYQESLQLAVQK